VLASDGKIIFAGTDDTSAEVPFGSLPPHLSVPCDVWLSNRADSDGGFAGYGAEFGPRGSPESTEAKVRVPILLETPWSNVIEVRRRFEPRRKGALIAAIATTGGVALVSSLFMALANGADSPPGAGTPMRVIAGGFIAAGVLTDVALLPTILASSTDEAVYPNNERRAPRRRHAVISIERTRTRRQIRHSR
jgi:hypothetical protein